MKHAWVNGKCIKNFRWKTGGESPFERHRCMCEDNNKLDFKEIRYEGMDWIKVAQDKFSGGIFLFLNFNVMEVCINEN
jgi:hypothetical protein